MKSRPRVFGCVAILAAIVVAGCGPKQYRQQADEAAYRHIGRAQQQALGQDDPFTVERPADTLRRRLMMEQDLPRSSPASLGVDQLDPVKHWPEMDYPRRDADGADVVVQTAATVDAAPGCPPPAAGEALVLSLNDALQVAAANSREYQNEKEAVFRTALALDLEANEFRNLFFGGTDATFLYDTRGERVERGFAVGGDISWQRQLTNGTRITAALALDLVKLLSADRPSSLGILADASITIPLMRGAGSHIVTEPLTQAQRNLVYQIHAFERFKQTLAVRVASGYLGVLQQLDQVQNAEDNYRRLMESTRRARRLADAGRLPQIQVDQSVQDELRARDRWVSAQQAYANRLDQFKITLGLPTDADVTLRRDELSALAERARQRLADARPAVDETADEPQQASDAPIELPPIDLEGGPLEMPAELAVEIALGRRLDLRSDIGRVYDAQRRVVVAADALRAGLVLAGSATSGSGRTIGSAGSPDAEVRFDRSLYTASLGLDLPLERTAERNAYRLSYVALEQAVRNVQALEDQVKLEIRTALRTLCQARESYQIQAQAVELARRRVASTELFLQAGRAQVRDVLEAQESLVSAQNALTSALVNYRIAELELQRDMAVLEVDEKGLWSEYQPD